MNILTSLLEDLSISQINSEETAKKYNVDHSIIIGHILSLSSIPDMIVLKKEQKLEWQLTPEGLDFIDNGSYEYRLFASIPKEGVSLKNINKQDNKISIGFAKAMTYGWLKIDTSNPEDPRIFKTIEDLMDETRNDLILLQQGQERQILARNIEELKKRKLILKVSSTIFIVSKGPSFNKEINKEETDLTSSMITSGSWKNSKFKKYNLASLGNSLTHGSFHPLMKVRTEIRQIFLNMGFSEMPTNNFVESSFWNFDALFQPQQHPSRDAHDTFFLEYPSVSDLSDAPDEYVEKVKIMHEVGGNGSLGYKYDWKLSEAQKLILRTHTTAVSTRMLYKLGLQKTFHPVKYFSIDRVFRNEANDSTHLSEFHQIEGVVADRNLGLNHLIGFLHEFFKQLGMTKLRFKPAFNPYTEPSLEVFSYHEGLKKWVEVGNSGIFRREMLDPMNIPEDVSVIAWGISLERPTMIKYGIDNIRSLIGNKIDLDIVLKSSSCLIR